MRFPLFVSVCVAVLTGCDVPLAQPPASAQPVRLFGPVISQQVIRGREEHGEEVLLLVDTTILRLNLREQRLSRTPIGVAPGQACWGLGRLEDDGSLWSLKGRNAMIRIDADGRVSREIALPEPHAGLFSAGDRLVLQKAGASPPELALKAGLPGHEQWTPWSDLRVRSFPGIDRVQSMALSLVACGRTRVAERPCWFPDEPVVSLISPDGRTRRVMLPGLATTTPEALLTAENPRRPVRDGYIDDRQRIWIVSTGEAPSGRADVPGGWVLARYASDGTPDGIARLTEPVRLILRVEGRRVVVLTGSGHVSEIASW